MSVFDFIYHLFGGETREEKIRRYIQETRNRIQQTKSKAKSLEREENKYTEEMLRTPRNKENEIYSKARKIAAVQIRRQMTEKTITDLEALEQNFENIALINTQTDAMVQTNNFVRQINEDTNMQNVNNLISNFQQNVDTMSDDSNRLSETLQGTLTGIDANTDEIVKKILTQNNIQLSIANRELNSSLRGGLQQPLPQQQQQSQQQQATTVPSTVPAQHMQRFDALKEFSILPVNEK